MDNNKYYCEFCSNEITEEEYNFCDICPGCRDEYNVN